MPPDGLLMSLVYHHRARKLRVQIIERNVKQGETQLRAGFRGLAVIVGLRALRRISVRRVRLTRVCNGMSSFLKTDKVPIMKVAKMAKVFC